MATVSLQYPTGNLLPWPHSRRSPPLAFLAADQHRRQGFSGPRTLLWTCNILHLNNLFPTTLFELRLWQRTRSARAQWCQPPGCLLQPT